MQKVVTVIHFAALSDRARPGEHHAQEFPEINKYLEEGYRVMNVALNSPGEGQAVVYLFVLEKGEPVQYTNPADDDIGFDRPRPPGGKDATTVS